MITKLFTSHAYNNIRWDNRASKVESAQNKVTAAKIGDFILAFAVLGAGIAGIVCGGSPDSLLSILGYVGAGTGGIMLGGAMWNVKTYQKKFDDEVFNRTVEEQETRPDDELEGDALLSREARDPIYASKVRSHVVGDIDNDQFIADSSLGRCPFLDRSQSG